MFVEKSEIEVIHITKEIMIAGLNLQNSGLPITFESLGKMWDNYTEEIKQATPNRLEDKVEYGICLNKVPDYIVGMEVSAIPENLKGYASTTIPQGE